MAASPVALSSWVITRALPCTSWYALPLPPPPLALAQQLLLLALLLLQLLHLHLHLRPHRWRRHLHPQLLRLHQVPPLPVLVVVLARAGPLGREGILAALVVEPPDQPDVLRVHVLLSFDLLRWNFLVVVHNELVQRR